MMTRVSLIYSKKTGQFRYANRYIGLRIVNDSIASQIKEKMPKRLSATKPLLISIDRAGKTRNYTVQVTA